MRQINQNPTVTKSRRMICFCLEFMSRKRQLAMKFTWKLYCYWKYTEMSGGNYFVNIMIRKKSIWEEYYGQMKPKLNCSDAILKIMYLGHLALPSIQRAQIQRKLWRQQRYCRGMFFFLHKVLTTYKWLILEWMSQHMKIFWKQF